MVFSSSSPSAVLAFSFSCFWTLDQEALSYISWLPSGKNISTISSLPSCKYSWSREKVALISLVNTEVLFSGASWGGI